MRRICSDFSVCIDTNRRIQYEKKKQIKKYSRACRPAFCHNKPFNCVSMITIRVRPNFLGNLQNGCIVIVHAFSLLSTSVYYRKNNNIVLRD